MTVYLGNFGQVELQRQFNGSQISATINTGDVNTTAKRFSFNFEHGQLITGDQIEIKSTDGSALDFINSYADSSVKKFIYVDEIDGIRLYDSFAHAVNGGSANAIALATPGNNIPISITVQNSTSRVLGKVQSYELNTERETVDTTTLSDDFRNQISTLIAGSGRMSCEWEYGGNTAQELPQYLLELILRTKVGSDFYAKFYLKTVGYNPSNIAQGENHSIWYEFSAVITACAVRFEPANLVAITADFIATSQIQLRMSMTVPDELLQEDSGEMRLDQDGAAKLLLETDL